MRANARKFGLALAALLLVVFWAVPAWAATPIYVRPDGDDTNCNGTSNVAYSAEVAPNCAVKTIQKGIDLVDVNGTVNVAAGTYDEQVVIDKSLTLQGVGDTTIIQPSSAAKLTSLYTLGTQEGAYWNGHKLASIINVHGVGTAGVTIRDLKIDGSSITSVPAGANYVVGISYGETGGTIDNVTVVGMDSVPSATRSYGMWLDAVGTAVSVAVSDSTITYYNKNGINARGAKLDVDIHDNNISGKPVSGQVVNGMGIMFGASGTVTSNDVNGHWDEFAEWDSSGIFTYNAGVVTIEGNTVYNSQIGIALSGLPNTGGTANAVVRANAIYNCGVGIQLEAPATQNNTITSNSIHDNDLGIYLMEHYPLGPGDDYGPGQGNKAYCNNIFNNDDTGAKNDNPNVIFDAENNWWGCTAGPWGDACDTALGAVDYNPWLRREVPDDPPDNFCEPGNDADNDGLPDVLEMGGGNDQDRNTTTDPLDPDSDDDGLLDSEDENGNGKVDPGETDPNNWDTDGDNLCDGSASLPTGTACTTVSKAGRNGEDLDGDEDPADRGNTETDPTKPDTDNDGVNDFNDEFPLTPGGSGTFCYGVAAYSFPSSVTYRPTARRAATRMILVTIVNNSGGVLTVPANAFTPQPGEPFTIVRVSPRLPRDIRNGRRATFSVLTQVAAGQPPVTTFAPYFNIQLACGVVTSASVGPVELEEIQVEFRGDQLRVEAYGSGIASVQLQLFDLAGRALVDHTSKGSTLSIPLTAGPAGKPLANGVYLYVVTVRGWDGTVIRSEVRKLMILR